jgi:hypothetical protein
MKGLGLIKSMTIAGCLFGAALFSGCGDNDDLLEFTPDEDITLDSPTDTTDNVESSSGTPGSITLNPSANK